MRSAFRCAESVSWRFSCVILAITLLIAGCGPGGTGRPGGGSTDPDVGGPTDPGDPTDLPEIDLTETPRELTAWEMVTAGIAEDGTVPKDVALQAFALTLGDIPGVTPPTADTVGAECGSVALRWVTQHADDLTAEELTAIHEALRPIGDVEGSAARFTQASILGDHGCTVGNDGVSEDGEGAEQYRPILEQELAKLEQAFGRTLGIPVYLTLGLGKSGSDTLAWASPQSGTDCDLDPASSCRVQLLVNRAEVASEEKLRMVLSHELVHCFQVSWMPATESLEQPDWLSEGFPDYAGCRLNPAADRTSFSLYILTSLRPLYARTYDASGFFFHLHSIGADLFGRYPDAYTMTSSHDVFAHLIAPSGSDFDNTWASAMALDPARGDAWYMPEAPAGATVSVPAGTLVSGNRFTAKVSEPGTRIAHIDFEADIVRFKAGGGQHGRISWDDGGESLLTEIDGQAYCRKIDGCECPPGTTGYPPQTPIPSLSAMVSVAGTTEETTLEIIGLSLDDYCRRRNQPEPPPAEGVDACIVGTWESDEWILPGPLPALNARGGAGAVVTIHANGLTEWDFSDMQPLTSVDSQIDVVTNQYSRGTATGRIETSDGDWTVSETNTSAMTGFMIDNILGQIPLVGGPGLFVLLAEGGYTCGGDLLSYSTTDPVEGTTISISLHRQ